MQFKFKDMLSPILYETADVAFVVGSHTVFNNIVCDKLRDTCISDTMIEDGVLANEFGVADVSEDGMANSVDFNTFMDVCNIASVLGKWFCITPYNVLTAKQKDKLMNYIKSPSKYGLLVVTSDDFKEYKNLLKIKMLKFSKTSHIVELGFPNRKVLKQIVIDKFADKSLNITETATDLFVTKMSAAYDEYDEVISKIRDEHSDNTLGIADLKIYMKGIEHYIIEDFVKALTTPISSGKTNNKKILRIMVYLEDEYGAQDLLYKILKIVDESISFRILINKGFIPIGINYFFKDVIDSLGGPQGPYGKMNEWVFRKKASLASMTSLKDWQYMKLILQRALNNKYDITEEKCRKALYELCMRSTLSSSRLDNIVGVSNVLKENMTKLNKIKYSEESLKTIKDIEEHIGG